MTFELAASLRRIKPQRRRGALSRRSLDQLNFASPPELGPELLFDTTVYVDVLRGQTSPTLEHLLRFRLANHSTIALAELTHLFGRLDPAHSDTRRTLDELNGAIRDIESHRLFSPSTRAFAEAGMLAGLTARLTDRPTGAGLLNDALLFLQARESGLQLVTRNIADFDLFDQLLPGSPALFYRT